MLSVGVAGDQAGRPRHAAGRLAAGRYVPVAAAVLLGLLAVAQSWAQAGTELGATLTGADAQFGKFALVLISLAATLPLGLLWEFPVTSAVTIFAASVLSLTGFGEFTLGGLIAQLAACYWLGRQGRQLLAALLVLPFLVFVLAGDHQSQAGRIACVLAASAGPMAAWAGSAARARREAIEHSTVQQAVAGSLVEHTARGERARISRELHDVVAHHISMIAVQAETARLATQGMPPEGAQRLSAIGDTARSALTEMRRLLGVLREDTRDDLADAAVLRRPQPGLAQLNDLLDLAREVSGAGARLIVSGQPADLDPGVELAAYRIVQEALSNARRHAPGAAVDVEVSYAGAGFLIRIRDNGPGPPPGQPAGHGLLGMRERAAAVGGELRTGLAAGGGFLVEAKMPAGDAAEVRDAAEAAPAPVAGQSRAGTR